MIKNINDFNSYLDAIKSIKSNLTDDELLFFRGCYNKTYDILPGVYWNKSVDESEVYHNLILEYPEEFDSKHHHLDTLTKMQHYGLATRLIDLSGNILTSLYFASQSNKNKDGVVQVYKVKKNDVLLHNSDKVLMLSCLPVFDNNTKEEIKSFCEKHIDRINENSIRFNNSMIRFLHEVRGEYPAFECAIIGEDLLNSYFVRANKSNQRMKVQDGYFIICGLDELKLKRLIDKHKVCDLIIPANTKKQLLEDLKLMGIHDDTIYPDIERTSLYLRNKKLKWAELEE